MKKSILEYILSPVAYAVYRALDEPENWQYTYKNYTIKHLKSNYRLWVGNGGFFVDGDSENEKTIGYFERWIVYIKYLIVRKKINDSDDTIAFKKRKQYLIDTLKGTNNES